MNIQINCTLINKIHSTLVAFRTQIDAAQCGRAGAAKFCQWIQSSHKLIKRKAKQSKEKRGEVKLIKYTFI